MGFGGAKRREDVLHSLFSVARQATKGRPVFMGKEGSDYVMLLFQIKLLIQVLLGTLKGFIGYIL